MRIVIADLLFSWPPHGGADVDVYHVARGLVRLGHDVRLLFARESSRWERGQADVAALPFPAEQITFADGGMTEASVVERIRHAVDQHCPDFVLLTQGYFLKVPLILALRDYRVISRCYAHETACHKDILRFRNGMPCPGEYRRAPDVCRACGLKSQREAILRGGDTAWTQEYMATQAWTPAFYNRFMEAMSALHAVVVTTDQMRDQVEGLCDRIHVIPNGIDIARFEPLPAVPVRETPVLLVPGRMEDPAKGMDAMIAAGTLLAQEGRRFEVRATVPEGRGGPSWLNAVGKMSYDAMPRAYQEADICVVPSLWDEPFGIVALEAMATAVPVCASRVGGLQNIVVHEQTGLLFERGDAADLAASLRRLLDDSDLRRALGSAGRARVQEHYQWDLVIERCYPALFAS